MCRIKLKRLYIFPYNEHLKDEITSNSLLKKFFRSQAQRAGNRQILEAWKKLHKPELFLPKHGRFGNFDMINLPEMSSTVARICVPD